MGATLGLIAGGILKSVGDARQQDAADARALALDDLRERRRDADIQQKRVWEVEDRNATIAADDKRAEATAAHQDKRDAFTVERDNARYDHSDKAAADREDAAAARAAKATADAEQRAADRDSRKPKTMSQIIAPILQDVADGKKLRPGQQAALDTYQKLSAMDRLTRDSIGGGGTGADYTDEDTGGGSPPPAPDAPPPPALAPRPSISPASQAPTGVSSPSAPALPGAADTTRKPPGGYPDAQWSDKAKGWVVKKDGKWNLIQE